MTDVNEALAAAARTPPAAALAGLPRVLVVGGAGVLGSAIVEQLLSTHRFAAVGVAVRQAVQPAMRGLSIVEDEPAAWVRFGADTAVIVFDRERHANGRDQAFTRPEPAALPALARRLQQQGVRTLIVAMPHSPAMLPQALKRGLASLDEVAVASQGFEHLVFMRVAQGAAADGPRRSPPQRLAAWMLSQLHWMVPQQEQPVRALTVARVVAVLARTLGRATGGTRVLPPELLWLAAQGGELEALVDAWLDGRALPELKGTPRRW